MSFTSFQFTNPLLIHSEFHMLRPLKSNDSAAVHLMRNITKPQEEKYSAIIELTIQINKKENEIDKDACFYAEITMQSKFTWDDSVDDSLLDTLLEKNATSLLISYARPIVAMLTNSSPLPAYNIPFINLNELFKKEEEKTDS